MEADVENEKSLLRKKEKLARQGKELLVEFSWQRLTGTQPKEADNKIATLRGQVEVGYGPTLHIGSEPNPTNLPLTTMWR